MATPAVTTKARSGLWLALLGAVLVVAGIAGQIEASRHKPVPAAFQIEGTSLTFAAGWSPTAYDLVRIGAWALLVVGVVVVAFALVRELRRPI